MEHHFKSNGLTTPPRDGHYASSFPAPLSPERYYTNEDIAILYAIIVAAQSHLDHTPPPKPLPAAALFKAYDEVLPQYDIDPDKDHHLSAFIFRVSGEHGEGNLSRKFQAILHRLGIALEFGDNTTASGSSIRSFLSSKLEDEGRAPIDGRYLASDRTVHSESIGSFPQKSDWAHGACSHHAQLTANADDDNLQRQTRPSAPSTARSKQHIKSQVEELDIGGARMQTIEPGAAQTAASKPLVADLMTRRHRLPIPELKEELKAAKPHGHESNGTAVTSALKDWHCAMTKYRQQGSNNMQFKTQLDQVLKDQDQPNYCEDLQFFHDGAKGSSTLRFNDQLPPRYESDGNLSIVPLEHSSHDLVKPLTQCYSEQKQLLHRARRAREIYLASRAFNYWAGRAATRIAREAIAKRHMMRYRCFRGWSQMPSTDSSAVDQLRSIRAVQKLRRVVADQEEQLSAVLSTTIQSHRVETIGRVCDRWKLHMTELLVRVQKKSSIKAHTLESWRIVISWRLRLKEVGMYLRKSSSTLNAMKTWQQHEREDSTQTWLAEDYVTTRSMFTGLLRLRDEAELMHRTTTFQACTWMAKARHSLRKWSLHARVEAHAWDSEYILALNVLEKWFQKARLDRRLKEETKRMIKRRFAVKVERHALQATGKTLDLTLLRDRARLYISAIRILAVFDAVVVQRKEQAKVILRHYLMFRYREVSSARKARFFFRSLDMWKVGTAQKNNVARIAHQHSISQHHSFCQEVARRWERTADEHRQTRLSSQSYMSYVVVKLSLSRARANGTLFVQAWESWALDRQRQCLKWWSILSLHQAGYAHTAAMVQHRHSIERRSRVLRMWKYINNKRNSLAIFDVRFTPRQGSTRMSRVARKTHSARQMLMRQGHDDQSYPTGLIETPTRSTGLPFPMDATLSPKPVPLLRETSIKSTPASMYTQEVESSRSLDVVHPHIQHLVDIPSTTPSIPVPGHLLKHTSQHGQLFGKTIRGRSRLST